MIDRLIEFSLKNKFILVMLWIGIAGWGLWAMLRAPIDAIPDLSDNQAIVFTDWQGRSPQEVEDQITYPLTTNLQGLPGVKVVRSSSAFGFSMIFVIFNDDVDLYFARTRVLERLNLVTRELPAGVVPTLGPDATGLGHVFWYTVEGGGKSLRDLRSLQDWYVRYQLNSVPGVAEVASVGGTVQQYQIDVDPNRLRSYGIPLSVVMGAVMASNSNVGGNVISENGSWSIVRGLGLIENLDDIRNIVVGSHNGTPVFVRDLGSVRIGDAFRTAALVKNSSEAVGGVIVARTFMSAGGKGLTVPESAVQAIGEKQYVFLPIKDSDGSFAVRQVKLGPSSNGFYPVLDGLKLNDEVVREGSFILKAEAIRQHPEL